MNEEVVTVTKKKKRNPVAKAIMIILDVLVLALALYFVLGYVNFVKIGNKEEPYLISNTKSYKTTKGDNVTVYDAIIYKIVKHEVPNENMTIRIKLWFQEDIN